MQLRCLLLRLRFAIGSGGVDLGAEVLDEHLVGVARVGLLLLQVRALILEPWGVSLRTALPEG